MTEQSTITSSGSLTIRRETVHFEKERGVTEIRVLRPVAHVTVEFASEHLAADRLALLQALAASSVPVFLVKLLPNGISFAVRAENTAACQNLLTDRKAAFTLLSNLAVVYTIAGAMRDLSGIMAAIYETLIGAGVRVQQTGDAYNAVLCLVDGALADSAKSALEQRFEIGKTATTPADDSATLPADARESGTGLKSL